MRNRTRRGAVIAASLMAALLPGYASAEVSAIDGARRIYTAVGRRHWILTTCAKVDPANKMKYDEALRNYDRDTNTLVRKVRAILVADARNSKPGISEQAVFSVYDRFLEADQNKMNHDIQFGDPEQFRQQCDYIANPERRVHYHASKQWDHTLVGLPADEYPAEVKAIQGSDMQEKQ